MTRFFKNIIGLALVASVVVPVNAFASGEDEEGLDYEYCQNALTDLGINKYTFRFETDGGTVIPDALVTEGCSLREMNKVPDDPTKDDHTFFGWFSDAAFHEKFIFGLVPDRDMTIYALFIPNENIISSVDLEVDSPIADKEVTVTEDTSGGALVENQDPIPVATISSGEDNRYHINSTFWAAATDSDERFAGTFVNEQDYWSAIVIATDSDYVFSSDLSANVNGEPADVRIIEDSNGDYATIYAKVKAIEEHRYEYEDEEGNAISFSDEEGHNYVYSIVKFTFSMTDEELAELDPPVSREEYEAGKLAIMGAVEGQGSMITFFEFEAYEYVFNDDGTPKMCDTDDGPQQCRNDAEGPFEIKIKYTNEMLGFDSYKLVYVTDDLGATEDPIELTLIDGYLVGTIPHFSGYVLVGSIGAPNTGVMTNNHDSLTESILVVVLASTIIMGVNFYIIKKSRR